VEKPLETCRALTIIKNIHNIKDPLKLKIMKITKLLVAQNYFAFQDKIYAQEKGLTMGAPTSALFAEIYLQHLENTKIYDIQLTSKIVGYFRYVDDILILYNENQTNIGTVLNQFNEATPGLSFTLELEQNNKLNFLDLTINRDPDGLEIEIYRKPTMTDLIIPRDSCHPIEHKMAAIRYFMNRIHTYNLDPTKKL
jgi:hypothetical protein